MAERTKCHWTYESPSTYAVKRRMWAIGFDLPYSYDFVLDLAHAYSYHQAGEPKENCFVEVESEYDKKVQEFIKNIDFSVYTGNTPIAKAASIIAAMSDEEEGKAQEDEEGRMALPIFCKTEEEIQEFLEKMEEAVEQMKEAMVTGMMQEVNPENKIAEIAIRDLKPHQKRVMEKLSLIRSRGKVMSQAKPQNVSLQQMTEYADVTQLQSFSTMALPTFAYRFATKNLITKKRDSKHKQDLVLLVDDSGSMDENAKKEWVKAICLDRLTAVMENKAKLTIYWYTSYIHKTLEFKNRESAIEFIKTGWYGDFGGGGTDIGSIVKEVSEHFKGSVKPHVAVIHDGQDTVKLFQPPVVIHSFLLGQDHKELEELSRLSKGHYERFM